MLLSRRRKPKIELRVGETEIEISKTIKYIWVWFEHELSLKQHVHKTAEKAAKTVAVLSRLILNVNDFSSGIRKQLAVVVYSAMLYEAPVWRNTVKVAKCRIMLYKEQRKLALTILTAYTTASGEALLVLAGIMPVHIMAEETEPTEATGGTNKGGEHGKKQNANGRRNGK